MPLTILVSNDDGYASPGIDTLTKIALRLGEPRVIAPKSQRSAGGKSLTFHKPIRFRKAFTQSGYPAISVDANPADVLPIYYHLYSNPPDLLLSGINAGENSSIHSVLTSGTCAVAMEAGIRKIPAFALSMDVPENQFFSENPSINFELVESFGYRIINQILTLPLSFWEGLLFININFPNVLTPKTKVKLSPPSDFKYHNYLIERIDPRGEKYYWLWGKMREDIPERTDSYVVLIEKNISITPISFQEDKSKYEELETILSEIFG